MEFLQLISSHNAILFLLLFTRISAMMAFFPFFSYTTIPMNIKAIFVFFMTIFLLPQATMYLPNLDISTIVLAVLSELMFGFIAGLILQIIFGALGLAGEQISFIMGFSMATSIDPMNGVNSPIIGKFLSFLAILILLAFNGQLLMLKFIAISVGKLTLGGFYPNISVWRYITHSISHMFALGFILSFPVVALSLLSDVIFGMLMKTMPQFNLLVVGFPIKIAISIFVLIVILTSIMYVFQNEFLTALSHLVILF